MSLVDLVEEYLYPKVPKSRLPVLHEEVGQGVLKLDGIDQMMT